MEACLQRIAERETEVHAWAHLDPALPRAAADARDADARAGRALGALHGLPVGLKDIIDTADLPTENGSAIHRGRRPERDAWVRSRLDSLGAVILGKTVTTEFAAFAPGPTRNPHDPSRTPGGSSSGSAAAVAAGMVPVALGSQTNGSVIRPASFCGVVGYKPSFGLIPRTGVLTQSHSLDHVGVFAADLGLAARVGEALMGHDAGDPATRPQASMALARALEEAPGSARLAFVKGPAWPMAEESTVRAFEALRGRLGAAVVDLEPGPPLDEALALQRTINTAEIAFHFGAIYDRHRALISPQFSELLEAGRLVSAVAYQRALADRLRLRAVVDAVLEEVDAILTLAAPGEAPVGLGATGNPAFCTPWTLAGTPALSLPLLEGPAGMPLGVQLVGAYRGDDKLFATAAWLVRQLGKPELSGGTT